MAYINKVWGCLEYSGKKPCRYCGHKGELVWAKKKKYVGGPYNNISFYAPPLLRTKHVLCKACAADLGGWNKEDVDWEEVHRRDEADLSMMERGEFIEQLTRKRIVE